jgi:hypothetical protein
MNTHPIESASLHDTTLQARTVTVEVSPEDLVGMLTCIDIADPCSSDQPTPAEVTSARQLYRRLFEAYRSARP